MVEQYKFQQIGVSKLAETLDAIKGPIAISDKKGGRRVIVANLAPLNLIAIRETLNGLMYGHHYIINVYQRKVTLLRTGQSSFAITEDLTKFIKA